MKIFFTLKSLFTALWNKRRKIGFLLLLILILLILVIFSSFIISALSNSTEREVAEQQKMEELIEENDRAKCHPFCTSNDELWLYNIKGVEAPIRHPDELSCTEFKEHSISEGLDIPFEEIIIIYKPPQVGESVE